MEETQWAAVATHLLLMTAAPHLWRPPGLQANMATQGNMLTSASTPPMTQPVSLSVGGRVPQAGITERA